MLAAELLRSCSWLLSVFLLTFGLMASLPARVFDGYACFDAGSKQSSVRKYRLNGLAVYLYVGLILPFVLCVYMDVLLPDVSVFVITAAFIGVVVSLVAHLHGRASRDTVYMARRCPTKDRPFVRPTPAEVEAFQGMSPLSHFYAGWHFNLEIFGVDVKMWLYCAGTCVLQAVCTALSVSAIRAGVVPFASIGFWFMMTWFCCDYMSHEWTHLYTYDLFAERVGFKLIWGCLCFYGTFYAVAGLPLSTATTGSDLGICSLVSCWALFLVGWTFTRGANQQKFYVKAMPEIKTVRPLPFLPAVTQVCVKGSDNRLLCSGFWRLARHINYFGEIVQSLAIALPSYLSTGSHVGFLLPAYYCALLLPREREDSAICSQKYGAVWDTYCRMVPFKVCPGVY